MSEPSKPTLPEVHLTFSPTIGALATALAKAQGVLESAPKNHTAEVTMKSGGKYSYSYADLAGVWDAVRAPLSANGLAPVQAWTLRPDGLAMTTLLVHSSGEWVRGEMAGFPVPDRTPQGVGTSVTYARRYTLGAMTGAVSEEDDDGGNGGKPKKPREQRDPPAGGEARPDTGPTTFPNFGKWKGAPISGAPVEALEFHLGAARKSLADPEKAKYHAKEYALIGAIEAELTRQRGAANSPKSSESSPPAVAKDTFSVAKELISQAPSGQRVDEILNRAGPKVSTEEFAELTAVGKLRKALLAGGAAHGPPGPSSLFNPEPGATG